MKLHSNVIHGVHIYAATVAARSSLGCQIYAHVSGVGSRSHARAFKIHMTGDGTQCRNRTNSHGANDDYAAGYAAWGWMMAELYDVDPDAVWGTVKCPIYANKADFHAKTAYVFDTDLDLADRAHTVAYQVNGARKVWALIEARRHAAIGTPGASMVLASA